MTTPVLLTSPTPLDTDPLNGERTKRHVGARPPFGFIFPSSSSSTSITLDLTDDAYDPTDAHRTLEERVRQWTGAPLRAIVPLPRRKRVVQQSINADVAALHRSAPSSGVCLSRATHVCQDDMDSGPEIEGEASDADGDESDEVAPAGSRYCSYESITAAEGLAAWSFEELRVECYAQSLIAKGTKPTPVVQPALAIPPAFVPRIVPRS